ncbi:MAG: hypothetical protein JW765_10590 [Deltaproteobacteria bacterium]|nr:hypothetical protein [Candidatus Zymogenaceae bacterium]
MVVILGVLFLFVFGCAYGRGLTYTEGGTLMGALYGAGIGAAIGSATGHAGEGAGIGSLVGSLIGGAIGYGIEGNNRYGYPGPYNDPYYDSYRDPYSNHPNYRGYGGAPPAQDPYYRQDPSYDAGRPNPIPYQDDTYSQTDTATPTYSEEYYQKQNRRLMSPGYNVQ